MRLSIGASCIPHPEKVDKGGEDAFFMTDDGKYLGDHLHMLLLSPALTKMWRTSCVVSHNVTQVQVYLISSHGQDTPKCLICVMCQGELT